MLNQLLTSLSRRSPRAHTPTRIDRRPPAPQPRMRWYS